jgi:hypothetical protein
LDKRAPQVQIGSVPFFSGIKHLGGAYSRHRRCDLSFKRRCTRPMNRRCCEFDYVLNMQRAFFLRRAAQGLCRMSLGFDLVLSYCFKTKREDALTMQQSRAMRRDAAARSVMRIIFGRET